jgi:hypothetical protein
MCDSDFKVILKEFKTKECNKKTATATKERTRKIGRPHKTRIEEGKEDLNITGIKSRPDMTTNHRQWKKPVSEVKVYKEL